MNIIALLFWSKFYLNIKSFITIDSYSEKKKVIQELATQETNIKNKKLFPNYMESCPKYADAIMLHKAFSYLFNKYIFSTTEHQVLFQAENAGCHKPTFIISLDS